MSAFDVGTMDLNGFLYLYTSNGRPVYTVDLRDNSPTFMKLVDPLNGYAEQISDYGTPLSTPVSIGDWGYHEGIMHCMAWKGMEWS